MADVSGRVVQDGADEVFVIVVTGVGITEGGCTLVRDVALDGGSLGAAILLHGEHQFVLHDVC